MKFIKAILLVLSFSLFLNADANMDKELAKAQKENKYVMFFFHIPGCPYCGAMLEENFKDEETKELIKEHFVYVDIYTGDKHKVKFKKFEGNNKEFAKHIGAFAYPATLFMDKSGKIIHGAIGYRNVDELLSEIKYITTKNYQNMNLEDFKNKLEFESD
jgi:thioredoxin-related protein